MNCGQSLMLITAKMSLILRMRICFKVFEISLLNVTLYHVQYALYKTFKYPKTYKAEGAQCYLSQDELDYISKLQEKKGKEK